MNTVKCTNRLCEKEYNLEFDNCPFCGTANPMEETERRTLLEKKHNDTELKPELTNGEKFSGWVTGIIWLNILFGGIRGIINSFTVMMYSPVWGAVDLGLQIIGIISLAFLLLAKKWALCLWVGYLIAVSIINGYLNNNDYSTFAIVAAIKLVLMFLFLQIREDGVSGWSIIFNKKKVDATNDDVNAPQDTEDHIESETSLLENSNDSGAIKTEAEEVLYIKEYDNGNTPSNESYISGENATIQIEENIKHTEKEPANETSDKKPAGTKLDGCKKVAIEKWWIYPLIIIATLSIVWLVVWITHRPGEPELGKYVYVDECAILHVNRNCEKIAVFHGAKPVRMYTLREIESGKWNQVCSACISDNTYETISHFIVGNDNTRLLHTTLVEDNYDMPGYEQFLMDIQDTIKQRELYANMWKDGYMLPEFEVFIANLGLVPGQSPSKNGNYEKSNLRILYDALHKYGAVKKSYYYFCGYLQNESNRRKLYNALKADNYDVPDNYEAFNHTLFENETISQDRKWLYNKMRTAGINTGSYGDFEHSLRVKEDLNCYYDKCCELGLPVGSYKDFIKHYAL